MAEEEVQNDEAVEKGGSEGEEAKEAEGSGGGFGRKKILMIALPLLLLAVGGGLYFTGMLDSFIGGGQEQEASEGGAHDGSDKGKKGGKKKSHAKKGGGGHGKKGGEGEEGAGEGGAFLEIPTMIVNLGTDDGNPRYLRLTVQLELEDPADREEIEAIIPRVVDQFQTYLRELRVRDLRGSAGIYRLQMELLWRVNQAASPIKVKDVLFQEILIQ